MSQFCLRALAGGEWSRDSVPATETLSSQSGKSRVCYRRGHGRRRHRTYRESVVPAPLHSYRPTTVLSGKAHQVITGVCLLSTTKEKVFSSISKVYFEPLSDEEIRYYIDEFQPYDKAGAYAIQEWIGLCKISKIEGLYSNIMGLPVAKVYKELLNF